MWSRRSRVVAHRPPGPLVHLSQISGPVRSFFPVLGGFLLPVGVLWEVLGALGGFGVPVWVGSWDEIADAWLSGEWPDQTIHPLRCAMGSVCLEARGPLALGIPHSLLPIGTALLDDVPAKRVGVTLASIAWC